MLRPRCCPPSQASARAMEPTQRDRGPTQVCKGVGQRFAVSSTSVWSVSLWTPSTLHGAPPPRACSHAASSRRSPAELISTTSTYRSLAGCQAGRHCASAGCGAPGRVEHSFGGRGTPSLAAPRTPFRKRTPVSLGVDHSLATSACLRWKRQSEAESKGGPPSSAPPPPPYKSEEQRGRWGRRL